jgi:hypothetical protein
VAARDRELVRRSRRRGSAWERNWGFVPLTDAELNAYAHELKPILDERSHSSPNAAMRWSARRSRFPT